MKVADSSYIVEGLLRDKSLFEPDYFLTPELALYEVGNAIWKHETLIRDITDGTEYLDVLNSLIAAGTIVLASNEGKILARAYRISVDWRITIYDSVFVALALETGIELVTLDKDQRRIFEKEKRKEA